MELKHLSVLLHESIEALAIRPDGIYVDGTMGGGGHSLEIAKRLTTGRLICIDQDDFAHEMAGRRLADEADKITFIKDNFRNVKSVLASLGIAAIDGMLMDLGVSSFQLDDAERGFSYQHDAPLDMRMDRQAGKSAYDVVNGYEEREIARILRDFGEERFAGRIARAICERRKERPVCTTFELSDIVKEAIPAAARREGPHPAKRTFQAIRIEVNHELSILDDTVSDIAELLNPGGRCAVITFHSLEDRIIKSAYARLATGCTCPPDFPVCVCGKKPIFRVITKKPIVPSEQELAENPRSRSAKLRVAERTDYQP